jgi:hypothetical protein
MKTILGFWLLAGALLQDTVNYDNDLLCSNANITDDLALYHLKTNPNCRSQFETLPENVDELIEAYVIPGTAPELTEEEKAALEEAIQAQVDAENVVVAQIVEQLKAKTTKTAIKESFKEVKTVGTKNLTQGFLIELIDRASAQVAAPESTDVNTENLEDKTPTAPELTEEEKAAL